jgi:hypothetical protein
MARIRTIKPEAFISESLAEVPVEAERTFFGLFTQCDDRGRHRDNAAVIQGQLWPLRPEHTAVHVEVDLQQLHRAGLLCRFVGCDGKRYLHVPTWDRHQKINKPSDSRLPVCRTHAPKEVCGLCGTVDCASKPTPPPDDSGNIPGVLREGSNRSETDIGGGLESGRRDSVNETSTTTGVRNQSIPGRQEVAGQELFQEHSLNLPGMLQEASGPGSRIVDLGSSVLSERGAEAPADDTPVTARTLVAEWIDHMPKRPPGDVIGQTSKKLKQLLDEGIDPQDVRRGLALWAQKGLHPSALPSVVNQVMQAAHSAGNVIPMRAGHNLAATGTDANLNGHADIVAQLEAREGK